MLDFAELRKRCLSVVGVDEAPWRDEPARWRRVGDAITAWMEERGLTQADVARRGGVSDTKLRELQRGTPGNYRAATLRRIERALQWPARFIDQLLEGTAKLDDLTRPDPRPWEPPPRETWRTIGEWIRAQREEAQLSVAAMAERLGVTPAEWRALEAGVPQRDWTEDEFELIWQHLPFGLAFTWPPLPNDTPEAQARPAALSGLRIPEDLTEEERAQIQGYIDAIAARRQQS